MRLAIVGSREFTNYQKLKDILDPFKEQVSLVVSGGARGADRLAERWADDSGIEKMIIKAEWEKYGDAAGFMRNEDIVINCNKCIAFWDGKSSGTKSTIAFCKRYNKPHVVISI